MACFLVTTGEAIVTTVAQKVVKKKENASDNAQSKAFIPFSHKLKWLNNMLWGGSALLALEHIWHGEVTPWFPFLTAASNPADTAEMLHEMATSGVAMAGIVTAVWVGMVAVTHAMEKNVAASQVPLQRR
jgi:hypothetical protein